MEMAVRFEDLRAVLCEDCAWHSRKKQRASYEQQGLGIHERAYRLRPEAIASPASCRAGTHLTRATTQPLPVSLGNTRWHLWSTHFAPRRFAET